MLKSRIGLAVAASVLSASAAYAVPVVTVEQGNGPGFAPFAVSNTDLLQTSLAGATSSGNFNQEGAGGVPILNNGVFLINGGNPSDNSQFATVGDNTSIDFNLNTATAPLGYNISSITTYGGWNDAGRDRQLFNISYSLVGSPLFIPFDSINADNPASPGTPSAIRAVFAGTPALTGVDAIRFEFPAGQENGYAGLGEVDVAGTPTGVPEPGAIGLLGAAAVGLLRRRR